MEEAQFAELIAELRDDADQATWFVGFLQSVVNDHDMIDGKLAGSGAGIVAFATQSAAKQSLILYCARAWDPAGDAISLRIATEHLPPLDSIILRKYDRLEMPVPEDRDAVLDESYAQFMQDYRKVEVNDFHPTFRVMRTEYFAHRVLLSHDRKKVERQGILIRDATIDDLLDLSVATINLVGQLGYLWDQQANAYGDRLKRATAYSQEYWRLLPVFREVENL